MTSKQRKRAEKIWKTLVIQSEALDKLKDEVERDDERKSEDWDWDPVPEMFIDASNLLYKCCCYLEDILNS